MSSTTPTVPTARELALQLLFHPKGVTGIVLILQSIDPSRTYGPWKRSADISRRVGYGPYDTGTSGLIENEIILNYEIRDRAPRTCPNPEHDEVTLSRFCGKCGVETQSSLRPDEQLWRVRWLPYGYRETDIPLTADRAEAEAAVDAVLRSCDCALIDEVVPDITEEEQVRYTAEPVKEEGT